MMSAVFLDYDQAALDREYDNIKKVAEVATITAAWDDRGAEARRHLSCDLDLAYGDQARQTLDIFPTAKQGAPVLAFIHGGYWHRRDKSVGHFLAPAYVASEIHFVSIGYRLCPAVTLAEIVADIGQALAWLALKAPEFGGDPSRLYLAGHSAGGHLTALMCGPAGRPDLLAGGCSISGLHDLRPIRLSFLNQVLNLDPAAVAAYSPLARLQAAPEPLPDLPPLVLAVGDQEGPEYLRQRDDLAVALRARRRPALAVDVTDGNHFTALTAFADPTHPLAEAMLRLIFAPPPRVTAGVPVSS